MLSYKMSYKYNLDFVYGREREKIVVKFLNDNYFDDPLILHKNRWNYFDFSNKDYICELKSRRCLKETYPTTIIGYNKMKEAEENETEIIYRFYFLFKDSSLYSWDFKKEGYTIDKGGRTDRGKIEIKDYAYIPCDDLVYVRTLN
tara:strand:- start:1295 stop:1729 length:435 start_codon:yes stop_codon:yes gene_type:complete